MAKDLAERFKGLTPTQAIEEVERILAEDQIEFNLIHHDIPRVKRAAATLEIYIDLLLNTAQGTVQDAKLDGELLLSAISGLKEVSSRVLVLANTIEKLAATTFESHGNKH